MRKTGLPVVTPISIIHESFGGATLRNTGFRELARYEPKKMPPVERWRSSGLFYSAPVLRISDCTTSQDRLLSRQTSGIVCAHGPALY